MDPGFLEKMVMSVFKKTGYNMTADGLAVFLDDYADQSNKRLESTLKRLKKGERGGEDVDTTAAIDEIEIVLAARRAWE